VSASSHADVAVDAEGLSRPATHHPLGRYLNRELSWLDFNARVLALVERQSLPLLQRVKFLAIFSSTSTSSSRYGSAA
jgi:Polyphosphate kinase N-terminal domain